MKYEDHLYDRRAVSHIDTLNTGTRNQKINILKLITFKFIFACQTIASSKHF